MLIYVLHTEMVELSSCTGSPKAKMDVQQCIDGITQAQAVLLHSDTGVSSVQARCRLDGAQHSIHH